VGVGENVDDPRSVRWLISILREDLIANRGDWASAGFHAIAVYRLGVWARSQAARRRRIVGRLYKVLYTFVRNVYSIELPRGATVGRRLQISHPAGIVVSYKAQIGDDCVLRQNVTIGQFNRGRKRTPPYAPKIGNGVEVGAGAVVVGGITVGDGTRIGPNAVVMTDIPPGGSAFAGPAKIMQPLRRTKAAEPEKASTMRVDE
jgi:serine O-acetyltransferase